MELAIEALGAKGDGIAHDGGAPVFVPFALPGERVLLANHGAPRTRVPQIVVRSPERQEPPCPHFGDCGGCDLQHAIDALYRRFKRDLVSEAFAHRGLSPDVADLVPCQPRTRRRAVFSGARTGEGFVFGFHARQSDRIAPLHVCHVVLPAIADALPVLARLAEMLSGRRGEVRLTVAAFSTGLDIAVDGAPSLDERRRREVVSFALRHDLARLTVGTEVLVETRRPVLMFDGVATEPPPGAFLQAVASAESAMAALAVPHVAGSKAVADLFAGIGTFALQLARTSAVRAFESDAPALAALDKARRGAAGLKAVATEKRDLFRRPVTAKELGGFDGLVFDPPRAGAEAQMRELAGAKVKRVAAVSCNPATLARDCRILVDGGYRLVSVTPVDQFLWSHHVEAVALLER